MAMDRLCKLYVDRLFETRCYMNVSIEAVDIIFHWERLGVLVLQLKGCH